MSSGTVKRDLNTFNASFVKYNESFNAYHTKVDQVSKTIDSKDDFRFLYDYLRLANGKVIKNINQLRNDMKNVKVGVNNRAKDRIVALEEFEKQQREKNGDKDGN